MNTRYAQVANLVGKTLASVTVNKDNNEILFVTEEGKTYKMYHSQDCCENVYIEDIVGDIQSLVGNPILVAEESTNVDEPKSETFDSGYVYVDESSTWTYYKFATIKGHVDIRWYGTSNGYYSERVDFDEIISREETDDACHD